MFRWCTVSPSSRVILSFSRTHTDTKTGEKKKFEANETLPMPASRTHTHTHPAHISGRHKFILCVVLHNDWNINEMKWKSERLSAAIDYTPNERHTDTHVNAKQNEKKEKWNTEANGWYLGWDNRTAHWFQVPISTCLWWTAYIENDSVL